MLYLLLTSMPILSGDAQRRPELFNYGFNTIGTGCSYLGLSAGLFLGGLVQMYSQTKIWNYLTKRNGETRPEYRLLPMTVSPYMLRAAPDDLTAGRAGMILFPTSLLWYGWSAENHVHCIFPQIATGLFGLGMFITFGYDHPCRPSG
jgi:MFS transporter, DHA1 family, multidrug resistance protein